MAYDSGRWFGNQCYFGFHADLHLWEDDVDAGARAFSDELEESLRLLNPDWIQVDAKGHAGYTSWFSKVSAATVAPYLAHDAVAAWREASRRLGIPLVCHYSGFLDLAAALKHPEWLVALPPGQERRTPLKFNEAVMCPRSEYFDEVMIPQLVELALDYDVDGFWVDGDVWAFHGCHCPKCREAFRAATGVDRIPLAPGEGNWETWWNFQYDSLVQVVNRYSDAVHARKPLALVCSNWLDTFRFPVEGGVHTDWISGDTMPFWAVEDTRREVRWLANRRKPWDLMSWPHLAAPDFHLKPLDMLCQEASQVVAAGGRYQFCENSGGIRSSCQVPWRMRRLARVGAFVRERQSFCQDNEAYPEIALLRSRSLPKTVMFKTEGMVGVAIKCLLDCHYGVDMLDEWALLPRLDEFKAVVIPEGVRLDDETVTALKRYVEAGGRLLVSGVGLIERFGPDFFGIAEMEVETVSPLAGARWSFMEVKDGTPLYFLPDGDGVFPLRSPKWGLCALLPEARGVDELYRSYLPEGSATGLPAAVVVPRGAGMAAAIPADCFSGIGPELYLPEGRRFLARVMKEMYPERDIEIEAPTVIDFMFRQKDGDLQIHLLNRSTGIATHPERRTVDEIPEIGGIRLAVKCARRPGAVFLLPENRTLSYEWVPSEDGTAGVARIEELSVRIHSAVIIRE